MFQVKGRKQINPERDGYIYILQKDFNQIKLQEDEDGEVVVDVNDIFEGARKWKWGIYTDKYYSVLLSAFAFKIPKLVLNIPNILISIKKDKEFVSINALVFAEDKELAFEYANKFRIANRKNIAFEFAPEYYERPLDISLENILYLLSSIVRDIEEIKETTRNLEQKTEYISFDTQVIKQYMEKFEDKFKVFEEKLQNIETDIKELKEKLPNQQQPEESKVKEDDNTVYIHKIKDDGVYKDGEKVYLNLVGSVFNYLELDKSFYRAFRIKDIDPEIKEKIHDLVKQKYFSDEKYITGKELKQLGLKRVDDSRSWRIVLSTKEERLKEAVEIFSSVLKEDKEAIEKAFLEALAEVASSKREISIEDIEKRLPDKAKEKLRQLRDKFKGKEIDLKGDIYIKTNDEIEKLIIFAIVLDAEKNKRKVVIK